MATKLMTGMQMKNALSNAFGKLTKFTKHGSSMEFSGQSAVIQKDKIIFPDFKEDAVVSLNHYNAVLAFAMQGLAHMNHTDFTVYTNTFKNAQNLDKPGLFGAIFSACEAARAERREIKNDKLHGFTEILRQHTDNDEFDPNDVKNLARTMLSYDRADYGAFTRGMNLDPRLEEILRKEMPRIKSAHTTADAAQVAHEIYEKLKQFLDDIQQEQQQGGGKGKGKPQPQQGQGKGQGKGKGQSGKGEGKPEKGDGEGDGEGDGDGEGQEQKDGGNEGEDGETLGKKPALGNGLIGGHVNDGDIGDAFYNPKMEQLQREPVSVGMGVVTPAQQNSTPMPTIKYGEMAKTAVHLRRLLVSEDTALTRRHQVSGRYDHRANTRLLSGQDGVFKRVHPIEEVNTAISIVVDLSGSMGNMSPGNRRYYAMQYCHMLADIISKTPAKLEILGFSDAIGSDFNASHAINRLQQQSLARGQKFWQSWDSMAHHDRTISVRAQMLSAKDYNERLDVKKLSQMSFRWGGGGTPDGSALRTAIFRTSLRPEKRKMVFLLTDGQGDHRDIMKRLCNVGNAMGVTVIGVGIDCAVNGYPIHYTVSADTLQSKGLNMVVKQVLAQK